MHRVKARICCLCCLCCCWFIIPLLPPKKEEEQCAVGGDFQLGTSNRMIIRLSLSGKHATNRLKEHRFSRFSIYYCCCRPNRQSQFGCHFGLLFFFCRQQWSATICCCRFSKSLRCRHLVTFPIDVFGKQPNQATPVTHLQIFHA